MQGSPGGRSGGDCQSGAFGYYLHRKLEAMGVNNLVVQPQDWDERGKGVKTDRVDALALCQRLDEFISQTNNRALQIERMPCRPTEPRSCCQEIAFGGKVAETGVWTGAACRS